MAIASCVWTCRYLDALMPSPKTSRFKKHGFGYFGNSPLAGDNVVTDKWGLDITTQRREQRMVLRPFGFDVATRSARSTCNLSLCTTVEPLSSNRPIIVSVV